MLDAIARALRLDEAETAHLYDLTRAANTAPKAARRRPTAQQRIRPSVQRVLDGMADVPAIVMNGRLDLLATSTLGAALYSPVYDDPARPANLARFCFFDPQASALYPHWDEAANTTVAMLRTEAGRHPYDRDLSDLIGELSTRSDTFRDRWANHNVRLHRTGAKVYHHPVVGRLTLEFEVMDLSADDGLALTAFTAADPASRDGLKLLASWAATHHDDQRRRAAVGGPEEPQHNVIQEKHFDITMARRAAVEGNIIMSKVIIVTGAGRGLGTDIAREALAAGHQVVATGRRPDEVEKTLGGPQDNLLTVGLDITNPDDAHAAVQAAVQRFGRIDVLINNAGNFFAGYFEEISPEHLRQQIETNLFGPMNVTRAVLPVLREQRAGHIITISSLAGLIGQEFCAAYAASKFGLEGWMESLRFDLAPFKIHTTIIEPGFFRTELLVDSSTTWPELSIDDYAPRTAEMIETLEKPQRCTTR